MEASGGLANDIVRLVNQVSRESMAMIIDGTSIGHRNCGPGRRNEHVAQKKKRRKRSVCGGVGSLFGVWSLKGRVGCGREDACECSKRMIDQGSGFQQQVGMHTHLIICKTNLKQREGSS